MEAFHASKGVNALFGSQQGDPWADKLVQNFLPRQNLGAEGLLNFSCAGAPGVVARPGCVHVKGLSSPCADSFIHPDITFLTVWG